MKKEYEHIDSPDHYNNSSVEVWKMMLQIWGQDKFIAFCEMSSFKYRMRMGMKPDQPVERDLEKARWYEDKVKRFRASDELFDQLTKLRPKPRPKKVPIPKSRPPAKVIHPKENQ